MAKQYGVTGIGQFTQTTTERLARLAAFVDQGASRSTSTKYFPWMTSKQRATTSSKDIREENWR